MRTSCYRRPFFVACALVTLLACANSPAAQKSRVSSDNLTVVIDAGHGGHDRGGIPGERLAEKNMKLDVAPRLRNHFAAISHRVVMKRDSAAFFPIGARVTNANSYRNAIFGS